MNNIFFQLFNTGNKQGHVSALLNVFKSGILIWNGLGKPTQGNKTDRGVN